MLEIKELDYSYRDKRVVSRVNFQVREGELVCLLGANGSGKTTILKCLNGIFRPENGEIKINGMDIKELNQRQIARLISMVPQEHSLVFSYLTIDLLTMGATPYLLPGRMPGEEVYRKAEGVLENLGILHLKSRYYNQLSGGERQLVLIGRALMQETGFMIMDEPTAHLDFKNQHLLMMRLKELSRQGVGIIVALHDPNLALRFCDRAVLIKEGGVIARGRTGEVLTEDNLSRAYDLDRMLLVGKEGIRIESLFSLPAGQNAPA